MKCYFVIVIYFSYSFTSTPLTLASKTREKKIVEYLLKHGADVHTKDNDGNSSLKIARTLHFQEIEQLLLQYGAQYWKNNNNNNNNKGKSNK